MSYRKKIAVVVTTFFPGSHASTLVTKLIEGFNYQGKIIKPKIDVASIYLDQIHIEDLGIAVGCGNGTDDQAAHGYQLAESFDFMLGVSMHLCDWRTVAQCLLPSPLHQFVVLAHQLVLIRVGHHQIEEVVMIVMIAILIVI